MNAYQTLMNITGNKWVKLAIGAGLVIVVFMIVKHVSESVAE